ncbi:MAG TPA: GNAT family N-acetyltransferase [Bacteroidales bacterium]|nr:GNAT family N-acetyltransferase [Bacteroidales bacterium]HSA44376.1 GNAT family N-acetyltransferase [Bacteroidales bacterium]
METIIDPIDRKLLISELKQEYFVKATQSGNNKIFIVDALSSPHLMQEIGRLRELTFRAAGGGTGKASDVDEFDLMDPPFRQLIVWDPDAHEIVGGYRFLKGRAWKPADAGSVLTPTAELFNFSEQFLQEYWPYTIELGRSFVQPAYQPSNDARRGMFALDNIWNGLGAIIIQNPDVRYFFGKITMYTQFNPYARDLILIFLRKFFPDPDKLVRPLHPLPCWHDEAMLEAFFDAETYEENYRILVQEVRKQNENIPPLVNAYMNLSSTMKSFGTANNPHFGNVEETGILVTIADIYPSKKERHLAGNNAV